MSTKTCEATGTLQLNIPDGASVRGSRTPEMGDSEQEGSRGEADFQLEDAQSAIGISMSHAHTRLMSPKTPAAEKVVMMEEVDGGGLFDGAIDVRAQDEGVAVEHEPETVSRQNEGNEVYSPSRRHSDESLRQLPSPWVAGPRKFEKSKASNHGRSASKASTSGPTSILADISVKRFVSNLSLPALPKTPSFKDIGLPTMSSVFGGRDDTQMQKAMLKQKRANTLFTSRTQWNNGGRGSQIVDASNHNDIPGNDGLSPYAVSSPMHDYKPSPASSQKIVMPSSSQTVTYAQDGRPLKEQLRTNLFCFDESHRLDLHLAMIHVGSMCSSRSTAGCKQSKTVSRIRISNCPVCLLCRLSTSTVFVPSSSDQGERAIPDPS